MSRWFFSISKDGDSTTSLGNLPKVLDDTCSNKRFSTVFTWEFMCYNLHTLPLFLSPGSTKKCVFHSFHSGMELHDYRRGMKGGHRICCAKDLQQVERRKHLRMTRRVIRHQRKLRINIGISEIKTLTECVPSLPEGYCCNSMHSFCVVLLQSLFPLPGAGHC